MFFETYHFLFRYLTIMEHVAFIGLGIVVAYLIGSMPTAVWYSRTYHGFDIRDHGSGNSGATNTFRVLGKRAGTIVMLIDMIKGSIATLGAWVLMKQGSIVPEQLEIFKLIFGLVAVTGHVFPIYAHFKGGKGIATLLGMAVVLHPLAALSCATVFLAVLLMSKYVSLGSMLGTLTFPMVMILIPTMRPDHNVVIWFGFAIFVLVMITHKKNIRRLINGEENKTILIKKRGA